MAKETNTQTYRVSDEVDAELRRLAKIHGGIDRALRFLLNELSPFPPQVAPFTTPKPELGIHLDGQATSRGIRPKGDTKR